MRTVTRITCLFLLVGSSCGWCQDGLNAGDEQDEKIQRLLEERKLREEAMARQPTSLDGGATVNPLIIDPILDNTVGLRFEERDAYFRILELARQTPLAEQNSLAWDFHEARRLGNPRHAKRKPELFPTLVDVMNHPDTYRGRPVSMHGVMRRLTKFDPGKNNRGVGDVYEGWIYTDDSRAKTPNEEEVIVPTLVVFQGKPEGLTVGGDLSEEVRFTGYFFKLYRYESQDRFWTAPLFLAGAVEWKKNREAYKPQALGIEVYLLVTLVLVVIGFVIWQGNRREMKSAIHPTEADFTGFPPIEQPRLYSPADGGTKLNETHDE